jgi:hypothetical protein
MNEKTFSTFPVSFAFANKILHFARREKHSMNSRNALSTLRVVSIAFCMLIAFGIPTFGQEAPLQNEASAPTPAPAMNEVLRHNIENWALQGRGVPQDWSHHHLVFSNPGTEEDAIANGTHDHWLSIVNDPRYIIQQLKRRAAQGPAAADIASTEQTAQAENVASAERIAATQNPTPAAKLKKSKIRKDWSESLGSGTAATLTGVVGTLSSSTISGSSTLTVDGVTFDASPPTAAAGSVQVNCTTSTCGTYTLTIGSTTYSIVTTLPGGPSPANAVLDGGSGGPGHLITTTNLRAAMLNNSALCSSAPCFKNVSAVNATVTPGTAANPLTLTATTAGTGGNSIVLSDTGCVDPCGFEFLSQVSLDTTNTSSTVTSTTFGATGTAATDGTTSGTSTPPTFAYWSVNTYLSSASVATNIATAVNANATVSAVITATANSPASGDVTFTAKTAGPGGDSYSVAEANFSAFTGAGNLLGGVATVQPNMYPALYAASYTSASCSDFAAYPTGQAGSAGAANIIAYDNLYVGTGACEPTNPTVYWAYNTGAYAVTTSPILSVDGKQIAFMESNGATASLVLIKWAASPTPPTGVKGTFSSGSTTVTITTGTVTPSDVGMQISGTDIPANDTIASVTGNPATSITLAAATTGTVSTAEALTITAEALTTPGVPPTVLPSAYRACTAPCMTTVAFANGQNDTLSAPFYDFFASDDVLYVGDDSGNLHQFTGVFAGNPAESGSPWPKNLGTNKLSSPVYDSNSGHVFVGDLGGTLHSVTAAGATFGTATLGDAIADAPMVDGSSAILFAFVTTSTNPEVFDGDNVVFEFSTGFTAYGTPGVVAVGTGGTGYYLYAGDFDNVYYESTSPPSGNIYVVGNTGATDATGGILYQIPIISGGMTTPTAITTTVSGHQHPWPSPATEFCNNGPSACAVTTGGSCGTGVTCTSSGTDYLFFSVYHSNQVGCTNSGGNGCILSYNISNPTTTKVVISGTGLNVTAEANPGCWATGGILPDNSATTTGASQIYFVNLNGAAAGGAGGGTPTSSNCAAGAGPTIQAVQASQASP